MIWKGTNNNVQVGHEKEGTVDGLNLEFERNQLDSIQYRQKQLIPKLDTIEKKITN